MGSALSTVVIPESTRTRPQERAHAVKVERELPSSEAYDLLELVTDVADKELGPRAAEFEERGEFPARSSASWARSGC